MPYIDVKVTAPLDTAKKKALKEGLGKIITRIPGKTEAVTMIGLQGSYDLYMNGKELEHGAYVEVKTFGETAREHKLAVAEGIFELLNSVVAIPSRDVYITFHDQKEWGCNGGLV